MCYSLVAYVTDEAKLLGIFTAPVAAFGKVCRRFRNGLIVLLLSLPDVSLLVMTIPIAGSDASVFLDKYE